MNKKTESKNNIIIAAIALVVMVVIFGIIYKFAAPPTNTLKKTLTIEIIDKEKESTTRIVQTNAEFLGEAVDSLIEGEEGEFGLYINTVNGITADYDRDQSWWCITKDGEAVTTGVDTTPVADGEKYEFTYTIG